MDSEVDSLKQLIRAGPSRGLDFVNLDELNRRTGIEAKNALSFALSDLLCNALDKHDATEINVGVQAVGEFDVLTVSDNGKKKFQRSDLELILDFENKASSKRGFLQVSRGVLGNALKCLFGYSYALAELRRLTALPITVSSGAFEYQIRLKPDKIGQVIESEVVSAERNDDGFTSVKVGFPVDRNREISECTKALRLIIFATSMVNPSRKLCFNLYGDTGITGTGKEGKEIRQETSALWYTSKQFIELFQDFVRVVPDTQLKDFMVIFRGFSGRKAILEVLNEARKNCNGNVDSRIVEVQFLPTAPLKTFSDQAVAQLFWVMKAKSKPIEKRSIPDVLGCVGEAAFKKMQEEHLWLPRKRPYILLKGVRTSAGGPGDNDYVESPYLVELAVFDRKDDGEGLQVFQCVNFMASTREVLSETFNVRHHLGLVGIRDSTSITIVVHIVSPVLPWLNYGKTSLGNIDTCDLIEQAFDKLLPIPKIPRVYCPPPPARPLSWIPRGNFYDQVYRQRLRIWSQEILVIDRASSFHRRPRMRGWGYRCEQLGKIDKGEFKALAHAINDCRQLKYLPMDIISEDPDESRHFKGIHRATNLKTILEQLRNHITETLGSLPSMLTDFYEGEKYYLMMAVEKGEILLLFGPICEEYGFIPYVSFKGWSNLNNRADIAAQCKWAKEHGLIPVLLLFFDHDPKGLKMSETFRKHLKKMQDATGYDPSDLIIKRFGLNKEQIDKFKLSWVNNLKTSSGKEAKETKDVLEYIEVYGRQKCEMESLYKDDETTRAAEQICREAIEDYLGKDAVERFRKKIEESKAKLEVLYGSPVWKQFDDGLRTVVETLPEELKTEPTTTPEAEKEIEVFVSDDKYGKCPKCQTLFNDLAVETGKLVRCRKCNQVMRLKRLKGAS